MSEPEPQQNLQVPDFASQEHEEIRNGLIRILGLTNEEAIENTYHYTENSQQHSSSQSCTNSYQPSQHVS
ncbi:hypothetical protein SERLA73DRAFT_191975 [Serpula lacrymans var. lacrymans S7.3]|uniref:Uncharacterized protein n=1 Tax=Serpula lacrymans var. lacrymans (strain S7.3) TaxID=936435 RepID=F8QIQ5_SERL3|nr:hypothetical protein SERLA73DRAFT_191975 [Serpula lacrymans var. lacrymans S7.3]